MAFWENSQFFTHFYWPKSCIWHFMDISTELLFHNASKEGFWPKIILNVMQGFKSAIFAKFRPKAFFWIIMKMAITKNIHNLSQDPPNPGFMQEKVQKGDFLKKPSQELKFFCCFRFLWISRRPGTLNWKRLVFLLSKILYKQCEGGCGSQKKTCLRNTWMFPIYTDVGGWMGLKKPKTCWSNFWMAP